MEVPVIRADMEIGFADAETGRFLGTRIVRWFDGVGVVGGGVLPDLRHSSDAVREAWDAIVLHGAYQANGMASFGDSLSSEEAKQIRLYIMQREYDSWINSAKQ